MARLPLTAPSVPPTLPICGLSPQGSGDRAERLLQAGADRVGRDLGQPGQLVLDDDDLLGQRVPGADALGRLLLQPGIGQLRGAQRRGEADDPGRAGGHPRAEQRGQRGPDGDQARAEATTATATAASSASTGTRRKATPGTQDGRPSAGQGDLVDVELDLDGDREALGRLVQGLPQLGPSLGDVEIDRDRQALVLQPLDLGRVLLAEPGEIGDEGDGDVFAE